MKDYDVIIIGAGIGGLSVGALLADSGKRVLVLEKEDRIGGRAVTVNYKGHIVENGIHAIGTMGYIEEIFNRLNKPYPDLVNISRTEILYQDAWRNVNELFPHKIFRKIIEKDILGKSHADLEQYYDVPLNEWVAERTDDPGMHLFFWFLGMALCAGNRYETCSAGGTLIILKDWLDLFGSLNVTTGVVRGGYSSIMTILADALREKGGELMTRTTVTDILIENSSVLGVEIETGERVLASQIMDTERITAPVVVNTLPIWELFNLVSEEECPRWYVDMVQDTSRRFDTNWTLIAALDKPLWEEHIIRWVPKLRRTQMGGFFFCMPGYGEAVGEYQVNFFIQSLWDEVPSLFEYEKAETKRRVAKLFDLFEADLHELFPDLKKHCRWKIRHGGVYSIAEAPGCMGQHRPSLTLPGVKNLYLVSDTIRESSGGGLQASGRPALLCVDRILGKKV